MSVADSSTLPRITVYFIQVDRPDVEDMLGPIKIGRAHSPAAARTRLCDLQVASPWPLRLLGIIPCAPEDTERRLHRRFKAHRMRGEWFAPVKSLLRYIQEYAQPMPAKQRLRVKQRESKYSRSVSLFPQQETGTCDH